MENEKEKRRIPLPALPPDFLMYACLTAAVLLLGAGLFAPLAGWLKVFVFAAAVVLSGYDVVFDAVMKFKKERSFDRNLLVVAAAVAAFLIGKEAEGAAAAVLFRLGRLIHTKLVQKSTNSIEGLLDQRPDVVNAVVSGAIVRKSAGKIKAGDIISVAPGEHLALDGVVISGASEVDISGLTGEATHIAVSEGSEVLSGSVNLTGVLNVRVKAEFDNSTVSRILKIVEEDERKKSKPEKKLARLLRIFTPAVAGAAVIVGLLVPLFGSLELIPWLSRAFALLAVSVPASLAISVQLTYFAGIGGASGKGILFKGAGVVDALSKTTSIVFDKAGTLTTGSYQVAEVQSYELSSERLLMLAAYAEAYSNHPIAEAIKAAAGCTLDFSRISNFREFDGRGVEVDIGGMTISAGNEVFMAELGVKPLLMPTEATPVYIMVNGKYAGRILLADTIRPDAKAAVRDLRGIGIDRIAIFTGEKTEMATELARQLGVVEFYADTLPEDKVKRLKGLNDMQLPGDRLVFVGDRYSDAPALSAADVGIVVGGLGSDDVNDAADMIIMTDKPTKITEAITLTRKTDQIVRENMTLSLALKAALIILVIIGLLPIWAAVLADAAAGIAAVLNAMRAYGGPRKAYRRAPAATEYYDADGDDVKDEAESADEDEFQFKE